MPVQQTRLTYSPSRMWRGSPNLRGYTDRTSMLSREMRQYSPLTGQYLDSMWLIDADQKNHPYLLDWYYTSHAHQVTNYSREIPEDQYEVTDQQQPGDYWMLAHLAQNDARDDDFWGNLHECRSESNMEASTSAPFFQESLLQHHDSGNPVQPTRSQWWLRNDPRGAQSHPQASFLEPPDFNRQTSENHYENLSDRSLEEQEQHLDWRNSRKLSRTTCYDDLETGDFNLHFDDVYSEPPETRITINPGPRIE